MTVLAQRLKSYLEDQHLSTTRFAGMCGMNVTTMSNYVNGVRMPDATAIAKILEVVPKLSADYLYGRDVPMYLGEQQLFNYPPEEGNKAPVESSNMIQQIQSQQVLIDQLIKTLADRDSLIKTLVEANRR